MPARIDPLDPDSTHKPAASQPARTWTRPAVDPGEAARHLCARVNTVVHVRLHQLREGGRRVTLRTMTRSASRPSRPTEGRATIADFVVGPEQDKGRYREKPVDKGYHYSEPRGAKVRV